MKITYERPPLAGKKFVFAMRTNSGRSRVNIFLNGNEIQTFDCDDPPCYQAFFVPQGTAGSTLLLRGFDGREEYEIFFFINEDGLGILTDSPQKTDRDAEPV
ncbi:hypothetical protein SH580_01410 [Coraliomargarita algicola]|uniref:Galectin n=1 Tax=Coraliomargarita algicola TaxID=3092156 RepID=A0ABZ0RMM6_9BACT|nr:hypothetical protein [Coraliomargarita sp. J2-16]WPJ96358.1 hypothetical protein SH580_01410 [Coraliomargarita sp. J2-16]